MPTPPPSPPQGLSLGFLASLQGPSTPKTGSDVRAALENIGNPGRKILCSLPVGRRRRVVQAACPPCVAVPQLGRTSTAGPTLLVEAAPTHDLFYCETRDLGNSGHQASLSVVSQQRRQLSTPCEGVRLQTRGVESESPDANWDLLWQALEGLLGGWAWWAP